MTKAGDETQVSRVPDDLVETLVRLLPDPALVVDAQGLIAAANPLAERLFGYPPGAIAGVPLDVLVPERFRSRHAGHRASYVAHPQPRPMGASLSLWALRRDGTEFPADISLAPLGVPERPFTLAVIRDITGRRAEFQAEARLGAIVSSSDDAIVSTDMSGTVTSWNPGAERLLGYSSDQMIGRSFWRLVPGDRREEMEERMARVRSGMRVPTYDTKRLDRDGHDVDVAETMSLVHGVSGEADGFAAVLHDITERKQVELELRSLLAASQRRERWLAAMSEIRLALFSGTEQAAWLDINTKRVSELLDADGVMVVLPRKDLSGELEVASSRGVALRVGDRLHTDTLAGRTMRTGQSVVRSGPGGSGGENEALPGAPVGPLVLAALTSSSGPIGVLAVTRALGRAPFESEDVHLVESFAQQAGLGLELAEGQAERAQFSLVADRERIARDLHDHVIQRLFAVGMSLQAAAHSIADQRALDRIEDSVEELDATIRDVRSTIFSLEIQATEHVESSARARILDVASMAAPALGFQPRLQFDGPIDTRVPEELVPDVLAVVREALSNAARHAEANTVEVHVQVGDELVIAVTDDGKGAAGRTRSSGLANLRRRAEQRHGTMDVGVGRRGRGTCIEWRVPLPAPRG
ncbi:MAG TPA: PAS domain S-box protein [Acidimicrobiales bacterium]|nr:PAS domain S-box protein [Acidimicrobiales bacterium]